MNSTKPQSVFFLATFFCVLTLLSSCSNTLTLEIPRPSEAWAIEGEYLRLSNIVSDESRWSGKYSQSLCEVHFTITIISTGNRDNTDSIAEISLSNQLESESLALQFYWSNDTKEIWSLAKHSLDDSSEMLGVNFGIGEPYRVSVTIKDEKWFLTIDPLDKITRLVDGRHEGFTTTFEVIEYDAGVAPNKIDISGQSIDAIIDDLTISTCQEGV